MANLRETIEATLMSAGYYSSVELEETRGPIVKSMDKICALLSQEFSVELETGLINGESLANYIWALTSMGDDSNEWCLLRELNTVPLKIIEEHLVTSDKVNTLTNLASYGFTSALVTVEDGVTHLTIGTNALGDVMVKIGNAIYGVIH